MTHPPRGLPSRGATDALLTFAPLLGCVHSVLGDTLTSISYPTNAAPAPPYSWPTYGTVNGEQVYTFQKDTVPADLSPILVTSPASGVDLVDCVISPTPDFNGLTMNGATCVFSGAPGSLSGTARDGSVQTFTITAQAADGVQQSTTMKIRVVAQPPEKLVYSPSQFSFTEGVAVYEADYGHSTGAYPAPSVSGGSVVSYEIQDSVGGTATLPSGLKFGTTTGYITGTPAEGSATSSEVSSQRIARCRCDRAVVH